MKVFEGIVISTHMQNTAVVEIARRVAHPLYKKLMKRNKKYKVDTAGMTITVGQIVRIVETKPISKEKYFKIAEIIDRSAKKGAK